MNKFIYVFSEKDMKSMKKMGYELIKEDTNNSIWVFENKDPEQLEFSFNFSYVLSSVLSF